MPRNIERLQMDIDSRLEEVRMEMFRELGKLDDQQLGFVAALLRAAYGKGVVDSFKHREATRAMAKRNGYIL